MATIQIPGKTGQVRYIKCYKCGQPAAPENEILPIIEKSLASCLVSLAKKSLFVWCQSCVPEPNQVAYWEVKPRTRIRVNNPGER